MVAPCEELTAPDALDYDVWLYWIKSSVMPAYARCSAKQRGLLEAWPK